MSAASSSLCSAGRRGGMAAFGAAAGGKRNRALLKCLYVPRLDG